MEGDAVTLIVTSAGETVVIDTGNPGIRDPVKVTGPGASRRVDHLVITHYHGDHYGGASHLATLVPIGADLKECPTIPARRTSRSRT